MGHVCERCGRGWLGKGVICILGDWGKTLVNMGVGVGLKVGAFFKCGCEGGRGKCGLEKSEGGGVNSSRFRLRVGCE